MTKTGKKYLVVKHKQKYTHIIVYFTQKFKKISQMGGKKKGKTWTKITENDVKTAVKDVTQGVSG